MTGMSELGIWAEGYFNEEKLYHWRFANITNECQIYLDKHVSV